MMTTPRPDYPDHTGSPCEGCPDAGRPIDRFPCLGCLSGVRAPGACPRPAEPAKLDAREGR